MVDWEKNDLRDEWLELSTDNKRLRKENERLKEQLQDAIEAMRWSAVDHKNAEHLRKESQQLRNSIARVLDAFEGWNIGTNNEELYDALFELAKVRARGE